MRATGYALYHPGNVLAEANGRRFEHDLRQPVCSGSWQGGFRRFHRDERDQLVRVESYRAAPAESASPAAATRWEALPDWTARYDALNRRVDKTVAGQATIFYWDTDRLAAEVQPSGALRVYVYADALAMTPLLFVDYASIDAAAESGVVYAVLADHLGCPERVEDMAGHTVWSAVVAPYGAVQVTAGAAFQQPLRWPGHYYDAELGLQYNRFRTYAPELGRYLEPDPLGRAGGLENVYAYTHNPLFRVDTHGLNECPEAEAARKKAEAENEEEGKPDEEAAKQGLMSKEDVEAALAAARARLRELKADNNGDSPEAAEARRQRYLANNQLNGDADPLERAAWDARARQGPENRRIGAAKEEASLDAAGLENNNRGNPPTSYKTTDGKETIPDADNSKAVVDVKGKPDDLTPEGKKQVQCDSDQLQGQRNAAKNPPDGQPPRDHVVIINTGDETTVRPSGPLADPETGSTVLHHAPGDAPGEPGTWHKWDPTPTPENPNGGWVGIEPQDAAAITGGNPN